MLRARVAIARIVGRRILIAVCVIEGLIWVVVVIWRVRKHEESQIVIEMMKPVMIEIMAAKVATGPDAVISSEVVTTSVRSADVAAVESTGGAAAASNSTNSAAAVASPEACCSSTASPRKEKQRGDDYDGERSR